MKSVLMDNLPTLTNDPLSPEAFREKVMAIEKQLLGLPQVEYDLVHRFASGVYAREVTLPEGSIVTGKIHRFDHINFLLKGEITVVTEEGPKRLTAPCTFISPAYTKRAAYCHTEVVWTNVIATDSTDPEEIEQAVICPSYDCPEFLEHVGKTLQLKE